MPLARITQPTNATLTEKNLTRSTFAFRMNEPGASLDRWVIKWRLPDGKSYEDCNLAITLIDIGASAIGIHPEQHLMNQMVPTGLLYCLTALGGVAALFVIVNHWMI